MAVASAYPLFSHTKSIGISQSLAKPAASWNAPLCIAPSPKKVADIFVPPLIFSCSAAPKTTGGPAATIPKDPSIPLSKSLICILPPLPLHIPVLLP